MPKNEKSKKNSAKRTVNQRRDLFLKNEYPGTEYGQVLKALGDCNFQVKCSDGIERLCHLRKSLKRNNVNLEAIVLVGKRDYQNEKGDIVYVYTYEESTKLKSMGEISWSLSASLQDELDHDGDGDEKEEDVHFDFDEI